MNPHRKANAFPDRRVPGDPRLLDAIQRRTPNIAGGSVTHVFGSTILTPEKQRGRPPLAAPWRFRSLKKGEGEGYQLTIHPGWVREIVTKGGEGSDAVIYHLPTIGGVNMDSTDPVPEIAINADQYVFLKFATDETGSIQVGEDIELIAGDEDQESTHYQPPDSDGAGGAEGTYYTRIGKLVAGAEDAAPSWQPMTHGFVDHVHELWMGENLGEGAKIFKKRDAELDEYQFRSLKGRYGLTELEEADEIKLDLDAESIGGGEDVYVAPDPGGSDPSPDEPAKFRSLRGLSYEEATAESISAQIQVAVADGEDSDAAAMDTIRIRGNGAKGTRFAGTDNEIAWQDGLVTSTGEGAETGTGWSGEITIKDCYPLTEYENPADPSTWTYLLRVAVRNGLIVGVNETAETREFDSHTIVTYLQSCSFYGTDPEDQR